jgi:glycerate dehydrogenase
MAHGRHSEEGGNPLGVFLDVDTVDRGDLCLSALQSTLPRWRFHGNTTREALPERIQEAFVVVANKVLLDEAGLRSAPNLQLVCVAATGTNNVDLEAAQRLGIAVCNVPGYATATVVQHVFMLMLALSARLPDYERAVAAGRWQRQPLFCLLDYPIRELAGKTLGIVGYGNIGRAVAGVAEAFGMYVLVAQRPGASEEHPGRLPLHEMLPRVDVLSLHCPLTPETRGLVGAWELVLMKPDAILINTARGGLVDEGALADVLRAGRLAGAGVDVLSEEPPTHGNPLLADDVPHLIVTPHIAWASREARQRLADAIADNVRAFLAGAPRNVVT